MAAERVLKQHPQHAPSNHEHTRMQRMASTGSSADAFAERRFRLEGRKHTRQYAQLYFYRLSLVRARYARTHTQNDATRLRDARGKPHVVIATVYKEQKLKPDVLSAYTKVLTDRDRQRQTERERENLPLHLHACVHVHVHVSVSVYQYDNDLSGSRHMYLCSTDRGLGGGGRN